MNERTILQAPGASCRLYVPAPSARPGERPDFGHLDIPPAGSVGKPAPDTAESALRSLPYALIRVLDDDGRAVGEWAPRLSVDVLRSALKSMLKTRIFDERMFRLHRQGKTSFYMKSTGEEAIPVAQAMLLRADDMCFPTYRVMGWLHARGYPLEQMVNQIFSNANDPLRGRQLPILFSARAFGFYSLSGNLASRIGHAVGWAMAGAYRGTDQVALGYIGEGSTAEGDFHEAMTFATVYRAPAILCITNNQWAISSHAGIAGAETSTFAAKALAYGMPGLRVDGNDLLAVWSATAWAAERARAGHGPTLIECFTYRAGGHSTSDDPTRYRPADEPESWPLGDPIARLAAHLTMLGEWDDERQAACEAELKAEIAAAVRAGEAVGTLGASKPPVEEMFEGVFKTPDWRIEEQRRQLREGW